MKEADGEILLINKPFGWTSFDVVNKIRIELKKKTGRHYKVGHAGTLDPRATGLLIVCTGKFTKLAEQFQGLDKVYIGKILLGKTTPSYDLETPFLSETSISHITRTDILNAAAEIEKQTLQRPPIFSAIKKDGKVAYTEARKGNEMNLEARKITIHYFKITDIELPYVSFEVKCSKGTYVRSIANDLGELLGCGACLAELCRTQVGGWTLTDATDMETILTRISGSDFTSASLPKLSDKLF